MNESKNYLDNKLTLSPESPAETDKIDETYLSVTNDEFMDAVFGELSLPRPVTCGFTGHPAEVDRRNWFGHPWVDGHTKFNSQANNYFTLASFKANNNVYRRRKIQFFALHAIMLDDIGTKVAGLEGLTLKPSWVLETSPGNYQVGYIFDKPVTEGNASERLVKATIAKGLCDPGADGPLARYGRLPVGVNGKHDPPFPCRLVEFHPDRRYSIEQIIDGLELVINEQPDKKAGTRSGQVPDNDDVYQPRGNENPVVTRLKELNLYVKPLGDNKHEICCPWHKEHTDGIVGGTGYFEPSGLYPTGGFHCFHGHCVHRSIRNLLEHLGISKTTAKHRSTIRLALGELARIVDCCERELAGDGRYYQRGGLIVNVITDPGTQETVISPLPLPSVVRALSEIACFARFDKRSKQWGDSDPPERHCNILYGSPSYPHLPVLQGLAYQPYLRPDGSLMTAPGYDLATGMFGLFDERAFHVPDSPTRQDAESALQIIDSLLYEFGFKNRHDRAAALSAILTAVIRVSLRLAPMFHVCAPQISSGKSYLTALITAFATIVLPSGIAFPQDDEECRKFLLAALLTAPPVLCFDNLTSDLIPHKSLCSALTEENITGRILGVSKIATVGTRTLFLSSGNNVKPVRDMTRRVVTINLDPACEIPAARTFKNDPVAMVLADREHFVSLALTIVRAWIVAGRPVTNVKPLATYTDWSSLCRQPLLWLGQPDPATIVFESMGQDPDRETLGLLLHCWHECFGNRPMMIRNVALPIYCELYEVISEIALERGNINRRRLGRWISRHAGQIVDGLKFERDSGTRSAEAWRVKDDIDDL